MSSARRGAARSAGGAAARTPPCRRACRALGRRPRRRSSIGLAGLRRPGCARRGRQIKDLAWFFVASCVFLFFIAAGARRRLPTAGGGRPAHTGAGLAEVRTRGVCSRTVSAVHALTICMMLFSALAVTERGARLCLPGLHACAARRACAEGEVDLGHAWARFIRRSRRARRGAQAWSRARCRHGRTSAGSACATRCTTRPGGTCPSGTPAAAAAATSRPTSSSGS